MVPSIDILLVEDNPGDVLLTEEALLEGDLDFKIHVVPDGEEALKFLRREDTYKDSPVPHIVLLDLNLPKLSGREVLMEVKKDQSLKHIPVVVLSTSKAEEDISSSYDLHANCFVTKPVDFEKFGTVVRSIQDFWMNVVKLPTGHLSTVPVSP